MKTNNKCREALELCIDELCNRCRANAAAQGNPLPCLTGCDVVRKAKAALAEPIRNCDVGDAYEQEKRFARWRKSEGCDSYPEIVLRWSQKSYEKGGADGDGK